MSSHPALLVAFVRNVHRDPVQRLQMRKAYFHRPDRFTGRAENSHNSGSVRQQRPLQPQPDPPPEDNPPGMVEHMYWVAA